MYNVVVELFRELVSFMRKNYLTTSRGDCTLALFNMWWCLPVFDYLLIEISGL